MRATSARRLRQRGFALEGITLGWNVAGTAILLASALSARSVALAGFGLDSLIEIGASVVVIWELTGTDANRRRRALRLIGIAFVLLAAYLAVQSSAVLVLGFRGGTSRLGLAWTASTAVVMFALAYGKERTGHSLDNPVLRHEARVTLVDGILATAVVLGLVLDAALGWWWADPVAAYVLVVYAVIEARAVFQ
jgi:divalent metal cation (Fe/Co/Zn/Cd) transporter